MSRDKSCEQRVNLFNCLRNQNYNAVRCEGSDHHVIFATTNNHLKLPPMNQASCPPWPTNGWLNGDNENLLPSTAFITVTVATVFD